MNSCPLRHQDSARGLAEGRSPVLYVTLRHHDHARVLLRRGQVRIFSDPGARQIFG